MRFGSRCLFLAASSAFALTRHTSRAAFVASPAAALISASSSSSSSRAFTTKMSAASSFYDFTVKDAEGKDMKLSEFSDKKAILVVNVASQCGFTPQYKGLQELQDKYGPKGFTVVAFPCNQFGGQEPGTAGEVCTFVKDRFKVTFPIMDKVEVNGKNAAPVFNYLKEQQSGFITNAVKWNFSKWLVKDGKPIKRYGPNEKPESFEKDIEEALK